MKKADVVVFKNIIDESDEKCVMVVMEMRGDRVLVRHLIDMNLPATAVYKKSELELLEGFIE